MPSTISVCQWWSLVIAIKVEIRSLHSSMGVPLGPISVSRPPTDQPSTNCCIFGRGFWSSQRLFPAQYSGGFDNRGLVWEAGEGGREEKEVRSGVAPISISLDGARQILDNSPSSPWFSRSCRSVSCTAGPIRAHSDASHWLAVAFRQLLGVLLYPPLLPLRRCRVPS